MLGTISAFISVVCSALILFEVYHTLFGITWTWHRRCTENLRIPWLKQISTYVFQFLLSFICDMSSSTFDIEVLYLSAFQSESSCFSKTCSTRSQLTKYQFFKNGKIFAEKVLAKTTWECRELLGRNVKFDKNK